ncbi:MAG: 2-dehydro-3-deoxy-6-phosphogalactonate aldolase [Pseudomonadota bacterium]|nr:2-dehydro-3-deoxy-6-phosphogalactonate aldolase [Pseudomonadota bacterium]
MTLEDALAETPVIAILRGVRPEEIEAHAEALHAAGVRVVEAPLNSPAPLDSIRRLCAWRGRLVCGAGTVLTPERVDAVAEAGGEIIVAPNTDPAVITRAVERGLPALPGFATATEAFTAIAAGARHLKLFPASSMGSAHLKALKAVLPPEVQVHAVGGVGPAAFAEWRAAGAAGFGLGSELYKPGQTPAETTAKAQAVVAAVRALPPLSQAQPRSQAATAP